jgi:hypothetical protein
MTNKPICYPYLAGSLEYALRSLTYELVDTGLVDRIKQDELEKFISDKIEREIAGEREYTGY